MAKYEQYAEYKDSGVEWLGKIPSHWKLTRIKYITECLDGARIPLNAQERGEIKGDIPYWGANKVVDYVNDFLFDEELVLLGEDGAPFFDKTKDVAFNVCGKVWPNNHVHVLRPNLDKVEPRFLKYALNCADYHLYISGSTRDKLNQSDMNDIYIRITELAELEKIANFLDFETAQIDTLIEKQQTLIQLLKEKRQAVISHAVTKGLNPDAPMKDSGVEWLGEVPEHWSVKSYRHASKIYRGKFGHRPRNDPAFYDGEYPFIQTGDVARAGKIIASYSQTLNEKGKSVSQLFPAGTLMMAIAANIGDTAILGFEAYAPDSVIGFKPYTGIDVEFLRYSFLAALPAFEQTSTQSSQANLNIDRVGTVKGAFPSHNEQEKIVIYLDSMLEHYRAIEVKANEQIQLMRERRTALISAAVTGKIDVRGWRAADSK
jgi:type I restriction enzyme S subunit